MSPSSKKEILNWLKKKKKNDPTKIRLKMVKYINGIFLYRSFALNSFAKEMSYRFFKTQYTHYPYPVRGPKETNDSLDYHYSIGFF
jgi:hypothetical protein